MRPISKITTIFLTALLLSTANLSARIITIELTGEITSIDQTKDWFNGQIMVGDIITGSYTYDSLTQDSNPLETLGDYHHYSLPYGMSLTAGGFVFQTNPDNVDFRVSIGNNYLYSSWDDYGAESNNNLDLYAGLYINIMGWGLKDSSGTALSSDALPTTPPVIEDWDASENRLGIWGGNIKGGGNLLLLGARVTSAELVPPEPKIIFVDSDATGANNGSSWTDAYNYLQDALAAAQSDDQIHVAQGIYKPDEAAAITPGDRVATFQLINGVTIKGGYAGAGSPDPNARDIELYETILSGDLNNNDIDVTRLFHLWAEPSRAENSYHVVTGSGTDETAVLDGFTIASGNANNADLYSPHQLGGGMYNDKASPTVLACTFTRNSARAGGGMYNLESNPTLRKCSFIANSAHRKSYSGGNGGGMYNYLGPGNQEVADCVFEGNLATSGSGIMSHSRLIVRDCIFKDNWGDGIWFNGGQVKGCTFTSNFGGGIFIAGDSYVSNCLFTANTGCGLQAQDCDIVITNCSFIGNITYAFFAGIWNDEGDTTVTNCISWGNIGEDGMTESAQIATHDPAVINYCCVQGWSGALGGTGNAGADPCFVEMGYWDTLPDYNEDYWYLHIHWIDGDYHLLPDSPCIDTGDPNYIAEPNEMDLDGNPRIIGGRIDMGAYEAQYPRVIYVDADAPADPVPGDPTVSDPLEDGTQAHPFDTIHEAIDAARCGDTVIVLDGTYTGEGNRDIDFHGKAITVRSENGPEFTIVDCQGGPGNEHRGFYFHNNETANSILDGFTITNGYGLYSSRGGAGNGLYCSYSSPTIKNCIITDGKSHEGIFCFGHNGTCNPTFINCIIANNKNGGIASRYDCNLTFINCTITGNKRGYGAGILMYANCNATLTNCLLTGNETSVFGGGIYIRSGNLTITNSIITDNSAGTGGGIFCYCTGNTTIANTIIWGNTANQGAQIAQSVNSWCQGSTVTVSYSDVQGGEVAVYVSSRCKLRWYEGNIDADPCFVDLGYWDSNGVWVDGDYHLLPDSPCIDAGDPDYIAEPNETDLDGKPRVLDGNNDGITVIDMGAYEHRYTIPAEARIVPRNINLASKGKWITCYIWLPEEYNIADIDSNSIFLNYKIQAESVQVNEQQQVVMARFSREDVQTILEAGQVELSITGLLTDETAFHATDVIRVIDKASGKSPK